MPLTKVGQRALELLHAYKEEHGDCLVPHDHVVGGYKLGLWVKGRRREYHARKLCDSTVKQLEAAGFLWRGKRGGGGGAGKPRSGASHPWDCQWEAAFAQLQAYADKHGHCRVKRVYKSAGIGLGRWVARQRSVYQGTLKGRLSASQVARLEELMGSAWNPSAEEWVDRMMCSAP